MTLPHLLLAALSGHLLARLHDAQAQARRSEALAHDLAHTLDQNARLRRELETTRATLDLTTQALALTSHHNQVLLQGRPRPTPKPQPGGFRTWGEVLGTDALGTGERVRPGLSLAELVATPLDREGGEA